MSPELLTLFCPSCARDQLAEAPPCADGHGDACPDRACVECGTALLLDAPLFALASTGPTPIVGTLTGGARSSHGRRAA